VRRPRRSYVGVGVASAHGALDADAINAVWSTRVCTRQNDLGQDTHLVGDEQAARLT
jgi:hypothetical protein